MSEAKCFLHPVSFREPFGLTLIEAMACGCPVVAFGRGSIRELIAQGKTGFVVEDAEEMVEAVLIELPEYRCSPCGGKAEEDLDGDRDLSQEFLRIVYRRAVEIGDRHPAHKMSGDIHKWIEII